MGSAEYRSAGADFTQIARELSGGDVMGGEFLDTSGRPITSGMELDEKLLYCETVLEKLEALRRIDEKKILEFAEYMKDKEGQKYVFMFYQREFIPTLEQRVLDTIMTGFQGQPHIPIKVSQLFQLYHRDAHIDVDKVKKAYADSSIAVHFLFFSKMADRTPGVQMIEHSEDVFSAFNEMAIASRGVTQSSANPEFLFKKASDASENYYLLYYTPKDYKADGTFKNIKIRISGDGYRITHRIGYFAK